MQVGVGHAAREFSRSFFFLRGKSMGVTPLGKESPEPLRSLGDKTLQRPRARKKCTHSGIRERNTPLPCTTTRGHSHSALRHTLVHRAVSHKAPQFHPLPLLSSPFPSPQWREGCVLACLRACVLACLRACVLACLRACLLAFHCFSLLACLRACLRLLALACALTCACFLLLV